MNSDNQKLFLRLTTLAVLVACLIFISDGESLAQYITASSPQTAAPVVSVLSQPDAPLRINIISSNVINPRAPEVDFGLTNASDKPIRAYTIRQQTRRGTAETGATFIIADMNGTKAILRPGLYMIDSMAYQPLSEVNSQVSLSVDFVEFADGTVWGADLGRSADRLAGRRAGVREGNRRLLQTYKSKGLQAVIEMVGDGLMEIAPPPGNSPLWEESFRDGSGYCFRRLKRALDKGGHSQVESELHRLSEKDGL